MTIESVTGTEQLIVMRFRHTSALNFVQRLYTEQPELADLPFFEQQKALDMFHLSFTGGLVAGLGKAGLSSLDIIYDVPQLQRAWERDTGISLGTENRELAMAFSAMAELQPSVILEQSFGLFRPPDLERIRRELPAVKLITMHVGFPLVGYPVKFGQSPEYDIMFTTCSNFVEDFRSVGIRNVEVVPHGFDASVLDDLDVEGLRYPVSFAGSSGFGFGETHWSRYEYLDALCARTPITCFLQEPEPDLATLDTRNGGAERFLRSSKRLVKRAIRYQGRKVGLRTDLVNSPPRNWAPPSMPLKDKYPNKCREAVFGLDMYSVLARSGITFHKGHDVEGSCSSALRLYEASGVGSMVLANAVAQMPNTLVPGKECVTYDSIDDCVEKVRYLLDHEEERKAIARAGQMRTLRDHTLDERALHFAEAFRRFL